MKKTVKKMKEAAVSGVGTITRTFQQKKFNFSRSRLRAVRIDLGIIWNNNSIPTNFSMVIIHYLIFEYEHKIFLIF